VGFFHKGIAGATVDVDIQQERNSHPAELAQAEAGSFCCVHADDLAVRGLTSKT
jgi:hypothetical protein